MSKIKRQTVPDEKKQSKNAVIVSRFYHKTASLRWFSNGGVRLAEGILQLSFDGVSLGWTVQVTVLNLTLQNGVSLDWAAIGSPLTWFLKLGLEMIGGLGVPS